MLRRFLLLFIFFTTTQFAHSNEVPILVITPSGFETPLNSVGSSVNVITSYDIEQSNASTIEEILHTIPGIYSTKTGAGSQVSVFTRGTESNHTKITIDGIEVYDPSGIGTPPALNNLMLSNIERIEIVRGPQSLIHGSDAVGGIINIITKKQVNKSVSLELGDNSTLNISTNIGFKINNNVLVNLSASKYKTEGIDSWVGESDSDDNDGFSQDSIQLSIIKEDKVFKNSFLLRQDSGNTEFDSTYYSAREVDHAYTYLALESAININEKLILKFNYNFSDSERDQGKYNSLNCASSYNCSADFFGNVQLLKTTFQYKLNNQNTFIGGIEYNDKNAKQSTTGVVNWDKNNDSNSIFIQNQNSLDNLTLLYGVRFTEDDQFGSFKTFRTAFNYNVPLKKSIVLKGSVGTGYKAPSLYELHGTYGNLNLKPEDNIGLDFGFINYFSNKIIFSSTLFYNEMNNIMTTASSSPYAYYNLQGTSYIKGIESSLKMYPSDRTILNISHTYQDVNEVSTSQSLRRPNNLISSSMEYLYSPKANVIINGKYVSESLESASVINDDYLVFDINLKYKINPSVNAVIKLLNIFDEKYSYVTATYPSGSYYPGLPRQLFIGGSVDF